MMICRHNWMEAFQYGGIYSKVVGDPVKDKTWGRLEIGDSIGEPAAIRIYIEESIELMGIIHQCGDRYSIMVIECSGLTKALLDVLGQVLFKDDTNGIMLYMLSKTELDKFIQEWEKILDLLKP